MTGRLAALMLGCVGVVTGAVACKPARPSPHIYPQVSPQEMVYRLRNGNGPEWEAALRIDAEGRLTGVEIRCAGALIATADVPDLPFPIGARLRAEFPDTCERQQIWLNVYTSPNFRGGERTGNYDDVTFYFFGDRYRGRSDGVPAR